MKKKIILLGVNFIDVPNRGVCALAFGHLELLMQDYDFDTIYALFPTKRERTNTSTTTIGGKDIQWVNFFLDWKLFVLGIVQAPFCRLFKKYEVNPIIKLLSDTDLVCASNGGDSFSDIYGLKRLFLEFISILLPEFMGKKVIFTPQTIGPFKTVLGKIMAIISLKLAYKVFVRDSKAEQFLKQIGVKYEKTRDISAYMQPQPINFVVKNNTIGINVNGLMWDNDYPGLEGKFDNYKVLIKKLTDRLLKESFNVMFVPHTYVIHDLNISENDYKAILELVEFYKDDERISYIDKEYTAQELKSIISQFDFFIGSRMHSNLAALTTNTPTVALAYSYKFEGTFGMFNCADCTIRVDDLPAEQIEHIIDFVIEKLNKKEDIKVRLIECNKNLPLLHFN